jgi:hypothetical protein
MRTRGTILRPSRQDEAVEPAGIAMLLGKLTNRLDRCQLMQEKPRCRTALDESGKRELTGKNIGAHALDPETQS